jgi:opacity protein-like surface antigen
MIKKQFIFVLFILLSTTIVGQSLKIGIGGGYSALTGSNDFTAEDMLNFNSGFHYGGKLLVGIPLLPIQFAANIYNNPLSSDVTVFDQEIETEMSFLSVGIGAEFTLIPGPVQPYLAGELLYTSFSAPKLNDITIGSSESKTGFGVGAGLYFKLIPLVDLDVSAHYNMNTLLSSGEELNTMHVRLNILYSIL